MDDYLNNNIKDLNSRDLIKNNIEDNNCRNLMVIVRDYEFALQYIEKLCFGRQYKVF